MPVKIMLDTNFLLIPAQFKVDVFEEIKRICDFNYEVVVLDRTIYELNGIVQSQAGSDKAAARLGLQLLETKKVRVISTKTATFKNVDKIFLEMAAGERLIVATQDKLLKQELKKLGSKVIVLMQKKYLVLE